jgi:hypothetical protein
MTRYIIDAAAVIFAVCVLVRVGDLILEPALPLLIIAAFLAGVAWLVLGRARDLS